MRRELISKNLIWSIRSIANLHMISSERISTCSNDINITYNFYVIIIIISHYNFVCIVICPGTDISHVNLLARLYIMGFTLYTLKLFLWNIMFHFEDIKQTNKQTRKNIANFLANSISAGKTGMILRHTEKIFCLTMLDFHPV